MKTQCLVCKKELNETSRALWLLNGTAVCMDCEFVKMVVYRVTLPGALNGYYDDDISVIADMLIDADFDSGYTIIKEEMMATKYYGLPEFMGF